MESLFSFVTRKVPSLLLRLSVPLETPSPTLERGDILLLPHNLVSFPFSLDFSHVFQISKYFDRE